MTIGSARQIALNRLASPQCNAMRSFNLAPDRNKATEKALNRCCRCSFEWQDEPFGNAKHHACPRCGSVYWLWLDYEQGGGR
jgi:ssDNA-binding Zn-finger/Zn-ribbon topoisomerase 1